MKTWLPFCIALVCLASSANAQVAQEQLPKTITIVVPFLAGTTTDIEARIIAERLAERNGIAVVVENKVGGEGTVAAEYVYHSTADGSVLLALTNGMIGLPAVKGEQSWRPGGFAPLAGIGRAPQFLVAYKGLHVSSVRELIAYAQTRPQALDFGSGGISAKIATLLLSTHTGVKVQIVPYKGDPAGLSDLRGGHIQAMFVVGATGIGQGSTDTLRVLAVVNPTRIARMPDVSTITEAGIPQLEEIVAMMPNRVMVAPPKLSRTMQERLSAEIRAIIAEPGVRAKFQNIGSEAVIRNASETGAYIASQEKLWSRIVKEHNLAPAQ